MYARKVSLQLKPEMLGEFTRIFEKEVIPLLCTQQGFKDEITFAIPVSTDVLAISLWDTQGNAETYDSKGYKDVLKMLENVIVGTPTVEPTEVMHSTIQEIRAAKPVAA
jgi:hypothetical protein